MDVIQLIRQRSTARRFSGGEVDPEALERILEAGRLAPSAKNRQTWRFVAVRRSDLRSSMAEACYGDPRVEKSGCIIAACTTNIHYTMPNGQPSHPLDLAFAVSYMELQAVAEGLGAFILGTYDELAIKELLTVPHAMRVVLLLAIGNRDDGETEFKDRLPRDRIISYDHW